MSNDAGNFLRKMVKFVANPTTDWAELDAPDLEDKESEYAKAEIKAMIERKRRNDFVRKRELDMLRKIRREGLSHDSALALSSPSNLDSESRSSGGARSDIGVKAKIDEIEQQMVGASERRGDTRQGASTDAQALPTTTPANLGTGYAPTRPLTPSDLTPAHLTGNSDLHTAGKVLPKDLGVPLTLDISDEVMAAARSQGSQMAAGRPAVSPMAPSGFANPFAVDVSEVVHDPDLDEAVIAFANADFEQCENSLIALLQPGGVRHESADSWLVLFDLYRALDMSQRFEALANAFAHQFGQSAPQWYSLPERVSQHLSQRDKLITSSTKPQATEHGTSAATGSPSSVSPVLEGWIAPPLLDSDAIGRLRCEILQLPRPWVMDWLGVESVTAEGASQLCSQLRHWAQDAHDITWIGTDHLFDVLSELAPTGVRDADPAFWMLRLELLRMANRVDRFDETAIDYCVTYELSPPSWEAVLCKVRLMQDATCTQTVSLSHIGDVSTSFVESQLHDDIEFVQQASMELAGQLVGDIGDTLAELDQQLGSSETIQLDCSYLIRVDFIAAGDLLNWVLSRRAENRTINFLNPHRLVALFFGAMGITEHAKVKLLMV
jgi:hypothetical protein